MTDTSIQAVIFDCDGVIVDSEGLTNAILRDMLVELGWSDLTGEECMRRFAGHALKDLADDFEAGTGVRIDEDWIAGFRVRRDAALRESVEAIDGVGDAVRLCAATFPLGIALASGADRNKIELQLGKVGLLEAFGEHVHSGLEHANTKPWPDVYLAAIAQLGADAARCVVVEDTVAGVTAGVAAGARVWGFAPGDASHTDAQRLLDAGAEHVFVHMDDLVPSIVAASR